MHVQSRMNHQILEDINIQKRWNLWTYITMWRLNESSNGTLHEIFIKVVKNIYI